MVRIWLAMGIITLASCAPITLPNSPGANSSARNKVGSESLNSTQPQPHFDSNTPVDSAKSQDLTNYLHSHQLPLVGARVLASNAAGSRQAILYGYVATPFGKADAVDKARQWLKDSDAQVDNRIRIQPDLAGHAPADNLNAENPNAMPADNLDANNPDLQKYQQEQAREQAIQQQQYMNQGSSYGGGGMGMGMGPLSLFMPLLMMGGGGSGMNFGFGSGRYGSSMGSPYGSPYASPYTSPYNSSPYSSPYPSYSSPYSSGPGSSLFGP